MTREEAYAMAQRDITYARSLTDNLLANGFIKEPPVELIEEAVKFAIKEVG